MYSFNLGYSHENLQSLESPICMASTFVIYDGPHRMSRHTKNSNSKFLNVSKKDGYDIMEFLCSFGHWNILSPICGMLDTSNIYFFFTSKIKDD